jgi:uncharacterized membrane protein (DUF106 family)
MSDQIDLEQIKKRVKKRVDDRKDFYIHAGVYVIVNIVVWVVWLILMLFPGIIDSIGSSIDVDFANLLRLPIPVLLSAAWMIGLLIHGLVTFVDTSKWLDNMQEREMQKEMERERLRLGLKEKPKRTVRLGDDGELIADEEPEASTSQQNRRRNTVNGR